MTLLVLLIASALPAGEVPRPAPPLKFTTIDGRDLSLEQLRGKVVVAMFFNTDCSHCQETTKILNPLYAKMKARGLEIVGLAINRSAATSLATFQQTYQVQFPLTISSRFECTRFAGLSVMAKFYVPYMFFLDRQGNIRGDHPGEDKAFYSAQAKNIEAELEKLLAEPAKGKKPS
jgi:peroxiredoxin